MENGLYTYNYGLNNLHMCRFSRVITAQMLIKGRTHPVFTPGNQHLSLSKVWRKNLPSMGVLEASCQAFYSLPVCPPFPDFFSR